ncbi:zinc finger protein RFP-like, partial [Emydura macquarii macquarii]|uniref:zinc finger protein RFP-like n=1 Tax=Emydura macquarii macquarii TaxID=1129001 RepID=UPI00352AE802
MPQSRTTTYGLCNPIRLTPVAAGHKIWNTNVTLDPGTAHPDLILSEDGKSVSWAVTRQDLPDNPKRFDTEHCVLGSMAAENPVEILQEEATCPVCLDYFREPVTLECGHNFCRACISHSWEGSDTDVSCPQCREIMQQRHLRPNRQLANMVERAKRLSFQAAGGEKMCVEHQEALKLFCEEDQSPICVVCDRSRAHRTHTVVPIQEVAQEYKDKIQAHLKILRKEREKLLGFKVTGEKKSQECLKWTETKRQKILSEFQQLQQFLQERERLLLAQLEKLDKEILKIRNDNVTKLSEEISRVNKLISELEGKCQKPASEFLKDVRSTLSRCEKGKLQQPVAISPELEKGLRDFSQKTVGLMETVRKFK